MRGKNAIVLRKVDPAQVEQAASLGDIYVIEKDEDVGLREFAEARPVRGQGRYLQSCPSPRQHRCHQNAHPESNVSNPIGGRHPNLLPCPQQGVIMPEDKPNCYECNHRGTLVNNCHTRCLHPEVVELTIDTPDITVLPNFYIMQMNPVVFQIIMRGVEKLDIKGHPTGIKGGWFDWPVQFDPTWLLNCSGFEQKESE